MSYTEQLSIRTHTLAISPDFVSNSGAPIFNGRDTQILDTYFQIAVTSEHLFIDLFHQSVMWRVLVELRSVSSEGS